MFTTLLGLPARLQWLHLFPNYISIFRTALYSLLRALHSSVHVIISTQRGDLLQEVIFPLPISVVLIFLFSVFFSKEGYYIIWCPPRAPLRRPSRVSGKIPAISSSYNFLLMNSFSFSVRVSQGVIRAESTFSAVFYSSLQLETCSPISLSCK